METADELFEKYSKELDVDTHVDITNLTDKMYSLPNIRNKWLMRLRQCEKNYHALEKAKNEIVEQHIGNSPVELSKVKITKKVENDPNYKKLEKELHDYTTLISYLESTNKNLIDMGYIMKNLVEMIKLETL